MLAALRIPLVCVSIVAFGYSAIGHWRATASLRWPSVDGEVMWSRIKIVQKMPGGEMVFLYGPDVHYRYRVEEKSYQAARVWPDMKLERDVASTRALLANYDEGTKVPVFYDPAQPKRAVLLPRRETTPWWPLGLGAFALGAAALLNRRVAPLR